MQRGVIVVSLTDPLPLTPMAGPGHGHVLAPALLPRHSSGAWRMETVSLSPVHRGGKACMMMKTPRSGN